MHDPLKSDGYDRVRAHTSKKTAREHDQEKEANLDRAADEPSFASQRLGELEHEWDIDRTVLIAFAGMGSAALVLGLRRNWRWRFPLTAQIASMLLHSLVGWSPQAAVLRRLGFRTRQEIESERHALRAMTGSLVATSTA